MSGIDALNETRPWGRQGVAMHLLDMGGQAINTASAMGRMFLTMTGGFAELERNLIAERTRTALQHKRDFQDGVLIVSNTKNGQVRRVPVSDDLSPEFRGRVGLLFPFVATSPDHTARKIRKLSGVPGFGFHRMRHTYANRWLVYGGSIEALRVAMGHCTVSVTERYGRLSDANVRDEANRVQLRRAEIR